jgi:hypothetical protein
MSQCNNRPAQDQKFTNLVVCNQLTARQQSATEVRTNILDAVEVIAQDLDTDLNAVLEEGTVELFNNGFLPGSTGRIRRWGNLVEFTIEGRIQPLVTGPPANPTQVVGRILDFLPHNRVTGTITNGLLILASDRGISVETDGSILNRVVWAAGGGSDQALSTMTWLLTG